MLLEKCLFSKNNAVITDHITKDINIQEISQSNMNKCHSKQSREAAYSLLESVIGENPNPEMLTKLIKNFWAHLIMKLEKPIEN
jgi:Zn-dependent M32 family carboxypeptidase